MTAPYASTSPPPQGDDPLSRAGRFLHDVLGGIGSGAQQLEQRAAQALSLAPLAIPLVTIPTQAFTAFRVPAPESEIGSTGMAVGSPTTHEVFDVARRLHKLAGEAQSVPIKAGTKRLVSHMLQTPPRQLGLIYYSPNRPAEAVRASLEHEGTHITQTSRNLLLQRQRGAEKDLFTVVRELMTNASTLAKTSYPQRVYPRAWQGMRSYVRALIEPGMGSRVLESLGGKAAIGRRTADEVTNVMFARPFTAIKVLLDELRLTPNKVKQAILTDPDVQLLKRLEETGQWEQRVKGY